MNALFVLLFELEERLLNIDAGLKRKWFTPEEAAEMRAAEVAHYYERLNEVSR